MRCICGFICAVKEIELLMEDEQRWKALPQDEQREQEAALSQNSEPSAALISLSLKRKSMGMTLGDLVQ
jgi:hypothetical protein